MDVLTDTPHPSRASKKRDPPSPARGEGRPQLVFTNPNPSSQHQAPGLRHHMLSRHQATR